MHYAGGGVGRPASEVTAYLDLGRRRVLQAKCAVWRRKFKPL